MTETPYFKLFLLLIMMGLNLGCGDAKAMAKKLPEVSDRYLEGLELGTRNGERMIEQIKRATIGIEGCEGQADFDKAVIAVIRSIRPPKGEAGEDLDFPRGYFNGYSTVFQRALHFAEEDREKTERILEDQIEQGCADSFFR